MEYNEAAALRDKILNACNDLSGSSIKLAKRKIKNQSTSLYRLHIINLDFENRLRLQAIIDEHKLAVKDQNAITVIYKPA